MHPRDYLHDERLRSLLPYLDLDLPDRERMVLLGLGAGLAERQLSTLPGLSNPRRMKESVGRLEAAGRIRRLPTGWQALPSPAPSDEEVLRRIRKWTKLRRAFDILRDPCAGLKTRGLGEVADALGAALSEALEAVLQSVDRRMTEDRAVRGRERRSLLEFIDRNLPAEYVARGGGRDKPPPAPADVLERTIERLTAGRSTAESSAVEDESRKLFRLVQPYGEVTLAHWWQILTALWEAGFRGSELWTEWRCRLESYMLRCRLVIPGPHRLSDWDPRHLKARCPVPDSGYGPWVDEELGLWDRFRAKYGPALGPATKDLWIRAHESVPSRLHEDYPFATPETVGSHRYEEILFEQADVLSGLSEEVIRDLARGRKTRAVKRSLKRARTARDNRALRLAVTKAAQVARDDRRQTRDVGWADRLLRLVAEMKLGVPVDKDMLANLVVRSRAVGRGGRRYQTTTLSQQVLRTLSHNLEVRAPTLGPGEPFPLEEIGKPIANALNRIVEDEFASPQAREDALQSVEQVIRHRGIITVAYGSGGFDQRTVRAASGLIGADGVEETLLTLVGEARRDLAVNAR